MIRLLRASAAYLARGTIGIAIQLPVQLVTMYPMLAEANWRSGGVPLRVGGWLLGQRTVAGITLGTTVFLADAGAASVHLLLHELGHVRQFQRDKKFPMRYLWESIHRGYSHNRYEAEADQFAKGVLWSSTPPHPS